MAKYLENGDYLLGVNDYEMVPTKVLYSNRFSDVEKIVLLKTKILEKDNYQKFDKEGFDVEDLLKIEINVEVFKKLAKEGLYFIHNKKFFCAFPHIEGVI